MRQRFFARRLLQSVSNKYCEYRYIIYMACETTHKNMTYRIRGCIKRLPRTYVQARIIVFLNLGFYRNLECFTCARRITTEHRTLPWFTMTGTSCQKLETRQQRLVNLFLAKPASNRA